MKKTNDFGRDSIPLLVLKISVPFMFAQFVNVLYSIVDRIYVGNIPVTGADALAGVGVCAPVVTLLSSFGTLFGIGGSVLFSVRLGAEDKRNARKILANSFSYLIIVSLALTLIFLVTKDQLLNWFGASDVTFPYADAYMTIYTAGTFFALLGTGMNYFITAQGFPLLGMTTTLIGAVINIVLDPVFIFLFDMGVAGAAVATVLAQMCSCAFVLCTLRRKKMPVPLGIVRPDRDTGKRIVKIGFSPFLILASDSIIIIALNAVLQYYGGPEYGDTLITAATIVQSYMLLITSPMLGITGGSQPLISFNYGANRPDRIRKTFFWVLMLCVCFTFSVCDRGRPDGTGHDKDFVKPFPDKEKPVFCRDLPDPVYMGGPGCLLCRAFCGRGVGMHFVRDLFLYLPEISAGRRAPRRDQTVSTSPGWQAVRG